MFSFELHFDSQTERAIRGVWDAIAAARLCDIQRNGPAPHVSIAVSEEFGSPVLADRLREFAGATAPIEVVLESLDHFPTGVLFLAPRLTPELGEVHSRFHREFQLQPARHSHYYLPENWKAHCTLATQLTPQTLAEARKIAEQLALPLVGRFERLVVVRWPMARQEFRCLLGDHARA